MSRTTALATLLLLITWGGTATTTTTATPSPRRLTLKNLHFRFRYQHAVLVGHFHSFYLTYNDRNSLFLFSENTIP
jgi:hypothetical protein